MGVVHEMIIIEERFAEMFAYLPKYLNGSVEFTPVFMYGTQKQLLEFQKVNKKPYPLIWLMQPYKEKHLKTKVELEDISFVLAIETNASMLNPERMETTFKPMLIKLYNDIRSLFTVSSIINLNEEIEIYKEFNFASDDSEETQISLDRWDAMKFTFSCTLNNFCLREPKF